MNVLLMVLAGSALAHLLLPAVKSASLRVLDALAFGPLLGMGVLGAADFLSRTFLGHPIGTLELVGVTALLLLPALFLFRIDGSEPLPAPSASRLERLSFFGLAGVLVLALFYLLASFRAAPEGGWDGLAVWGLLGRSIAVAPGSAREVLAGIHLGQPDYPHFLPEILAVLAGDDLAELGAAGRHSAILGLMSLGLIVHRILARLGGKLQANLGAILILTTPLYLRLAADHYADGILAAQNFAALGLVLLALARPEKASRYLLLAGLFAGLMPWTKAEGLFLLASITVVLFGLWPGAFRARLKSLALFGLGVAPFLALVLVHRQRVAPPGRRLDLDLDVVLEQLVDGARWREIMAAIGEELSAQLRDLSWQLDPGFLPPQQRWAFFMPGIALLMLMSLGRRHRTRATLVVIAVFVLQVAAYLFILAGLAERLDFVLDNALSRLMAQLLPILLLWPLAGSGEPEVEGEAGVDDAEAAGLVEGEGSGVP